MKEQDSDFFFSALVPSTVRQHSNNRLCFNEQFTVPQSDAEELSTLSYLILTIYLRLHFHITNEETEAHATKLMEKMAKIQTQVCLIEASFLFTIDI